jgi:hypothetical protein
MLKDRRQGKNRGKLQNKKLKYFCENQGDVKVVAGSKLALLSGNYHENLGPVASFWRQQT